MLVHDCKLRVDGITKFLDNTDFAFDHTFNEDDTTEDLYHYTAAPLIPFVFNKQGRATCFAYGQTGSGKTYTMAGIQQFAAHDIFAMLRQEGAVRLSSHMFVYVYLSCMCVYVSSLKLREVEGPSGDVGVRGRGYAIDKGYGGKTRRRLTFLCPSPLFAS